MNNPLKQDSDNELIESPFIVFEAFIAAVPMWFLPSALYEGRFFTVAGLFLITAVIGVRLRLSHADRRTERLTWLTFTWLWAAMSTACVVARPAFLFIEFGRLDGPAIIGTRLALAFGLVAMISFIIRWKTHGGAA